MSTEDKVHRFRLAEPLEAALHLFDHGVKVHFITVELLNHSDLEISDRRIGYLAIPFVQATPSCCFRILWVEGQENQFIRDAFSTARSALPSLMPIAHGDSVSMRNTSWQFLLQSPGLGGCEFKDRDYRQSLHNDFGPSWRGLKKSTSPKVSSNRARESMMSGSQRDCTGTVRWQ
jgi:hypothetical protein